ncbi:DNA damage-regulated autophagy modulator protein 2-like [Ostrea edulis]|uniref:DNA damage-regulated autophagy modulator protein 2-like n=1 Tax=Ostrea edulis TaxID=37623 RepID=UPI0024AE9E60|nr:DNA damage-regulated autophagy modulator protein 2-like [Ostrea edulis]XP_055996615.1 DNA damage-regulated autophagy modulator protein 2-like [Ostrea edulis]
MCNGLHIFPICVVLVSLTTFCVTYILSVWRKDVNPVLPYISDTGTTPYESCLFSFFLNLSAIGAFCTMYIRYRWVRLVSHEERSLRCYNILGLLLGWLSALGLGLVANFQETNLKGVHMTGAAMTIGCGILYMYLQTVLSYKMADTLSLSRVRLLMAIFCTLTATSFLIATVVAKSLRSSTTDTLHWETSEKGYAAHVTAAVSEWLTCIVFLLFFTTFVQDFKRTTASLSFHINTIAEGEGIKV